MLLMSLLKFSVCSCKVAHACCYNSLAAGPIAGHDELINRGGHDKCEKPLVMKQLTAVEVRKSNNLICD
jgi:hypothetical protein